MMMICDNLAHKALEKRHIDFFFKFLLRKLLLTMVNSSKTHFNIFFAFFHSWYENTTDV